MFDDQRIEPLNEAEQAWVRDEIARARELVRYYCPDTPDAPLTPEILDRVFADAYDAAPDGDGDYANAMINAVGIAFGQYLVDTLGFEWCAVFDSEGQEIAVVALPDTAKVRVFPPNLVAKRWQNGTTDFLGYVYKGIEGELDRFRRDWEADEQPQQASDSRTGWVAWIQRLFSRTPRN